jgi:hypothetical protein
MLPKNFKANDYVHCLPPRVTYLQAALYLLVSSILTWMSFTWRRVSSQARTLPATASSNSSQATILTYNSSCSGHAPPHHSQQQQQPGRHPHLQQQLLRSCTSPPQPQQQHPGRHPHLQQQLLRERAAPPHHSPSNSTQAAILTYNSSC